jgi:hypothetical protein
MRRIENRLFRSIHRVGTDKGSRLDKRQTRFVVKIHTDSKKTGIAPSSLKGASHVKDSHKLSSEFIKTKNW